MATAAILLCALQTEPGGDDRPQFFFSVYGGAEFTVDSDLDLRRPGTDLTFEDVPWENRSFRAPPYYGLRAGIFFGARSAWGIGLEFIHAKVIAEVEEVVRVSGMRDGLPVDGDERIDQTIASFELTHGLNFVFANAMYRFLFEEESFWSRFEPYLGAGMGIVIPHAEASIGTESTGGYVFGGLGYQAFAGLSALVAGPVAVFVEVKITYADLDPLDAPGGTIRVAPVAHQVAFGITVRI
ncbi:MAG: hypothetical protein HYY17_06045 [Planctomycetes bacterium]|nr:hypothetical protein [Planctomycetota bacterium]